MPKWAEAFIDEVRPLFDMEYPDTVIGFAFRPATRKRPFQLALFPTKLEVKEIGPEDGRTFRTSMALCITGVLKLFGSQVHVDWVAPSRYHGQLDSPHVLFDGSVGTRRLILRVFDRPPKDYNFVTVFDVATGECRPSQDHSNA